MKSSLSKPLKRKVGSCFIVLALYAIGMVVTGTAIGISLAVDMLTFKEATIIGALYFLPVILLCITFILSVSGLLFLVGKQLKNADRD